MSSYRIFLLLQIVLLYAVADFGCFQNADSLKQLAEEDVLNGFCDAEEVSCKKKEIYRNAEIIL